MREPTPIRHAKVPNGPDKRTPAASEGDCEGRYPGSWVAVECNVCAPTAEASPSHALSERSGCERPGAAARNFSIHLPLRGQRRRCASSTHAPASRLTPQSTHDVRGTFEPWWTQRLRRVPTKAGLCSPRPALSAAPAPYSGSRALPPASPGTNENDEVLFCRRLKVKNEISRIALFSPDRRRCKRKIDDADGRHCGSTAVGPPNTGASCPARSTGIQVRRAGNGCR